MNICKLLLTLIITVLFTACGVKSAPVADESFFIPYPKEVALASQDGGILVKNDSDTFTVLVEVRENTNNLARQDEFRRLTLISPNQSYLDKYVEDGKVYSYRFYNYYELHNTFSYPLTKQITYKAPVRLNGLTYEERNYSLCIKADLNDKTEFASININGRNVGLLEDIEQCFALPNTAIIELLILPYDKNGIQGTPYIRTIERDVTKILLPPQNVRVIRHNDRIVISWDESLSSGAEYALYVMEDNERNLVNKTNITVESYRAEDINRCIDFEISSIKDDNESPSVKVTSCP